MKKASKVRSESALKVRVSELEVRLDNLHQLVTHIAHNQEQIVEAISGNETVDEPKKKDKVCLINKCEDCDCECETKDCETCDCDKVK